MPDFPKFEDWTPPWGTDEAAFDADKAKKRIYDLLKDKHVSKERTTALEAEKDALQTKVTEFEEKDLSEVEKLRKENERLKNGDAPKKSTTQSGDDLRADRLEIALEKGLTKAQAARLVGTTREELEADAEAYIEEHGLRAASDGDGENDGGKEGQAPPSQRAKVRTGTKQGQTEVDPLEGLSPAEMLAKVRAGT